MIVTIQNAGQRNPRALFQRLVGQYIAEWGTNPEHVELLPKIVVTRDEEEAGQARTMVRALSRFTERKPAGEWLTLLEDDIVICERFLPYVVEHVHDPGVHVVQWFANGNVPAGGPRWHVLEGEQYYFNQATSFSPDFLRVLLASPLTASWDVAHTGDILVQKLLHELGWDFAIHRRSLVQHVGYPSMVAPGLKLKDWRVSRTFVGEKFDARLLEKEGV